MSTITFENAAWAIDGALLNSSLARRAEYASTSGEQGIVQKPDLKVTQLAVPGVGVQIAPGVALVLNEYQDNPNETYVVSNPSTHTIPSGEMPAANPAARSFIVAVVIGDPDFSQTGHPWMGSDDPPVGEEQSFQYVRPTLIEVSPGATTLPPTYPGLPLARIDIPANTTTITDSMIVDLRYLANPRSYQRLFASPADTWTGVKIPSGSNYADWGAAQYSPTVKVPSWATRCVVTVRVNGVALRDTSVNIFAYLKVVIGNLTGPIIANDLLSQAGLGTARFNFEAAGEMDVTAIAGTSVALKVQGFESVPASPTSNQQLELLPTSQMVYDVRFFEE